MAGTGSKWWGISLKMWAVLIGCIPVALMVIASERRLKQGGFSGTGSRDAESGFLMKAQSFLWQRGELSYTHVWPDMKFGWKIVLGTVIGFFGSAFGSVGGVGGGGIYVPMLTLIIGFDAKSSTAMSKCMITGAAGATVYYNLKLRHPTLELPIIDYNLALLIQPMLVLGISVGVAFNVIFAEWMITVLLIVLFLGMSTKAFFKGIETWKKETIVKQEAVRRLQSNDDGSEEIEYIPIPGGPSTSKQTEINEHKKEVSIVENVYWKELGLLFSVWFIILVLQIVKNYTTTCSVAYWVLNLLQIPVAVGFSLYQAIYLYKGKKKVASISEEGTNWQVHKLILYCTSGLLAGVVGGLLGLGGGFILAPLFLELGIPPQVSSATATFAMTFSASMSVVEYYLLKRFPVPYAMYFVAVTTFAAFVGQCVVRKLVTLLGRASLIIFILAFTIFVSAVSLGGVGIAKMVEKIEKHDYMGFDNICSYKD